MEIRVAAYTVIVRDERILLAHWSGAGRWAGAMPGAWTLPGGGLDPGEHPEAAAVREAREETGYDVAIDRLLGVDSIVVEAGSPSTDGTPRRAPVQGIRIVYGAQVISGELRSETGGSTDRAAWHRLSDVDALDRVELVDAARRFAGLIP